MAKALRQSLSKNAIEMSHSQCLELVAAQFGFENWNILSAQIDAGKVKQTPLPMALGWFATGFTDTKRYRLGLDPGFPGLALIECTVGRDESLGDERFACMMQSIDAERYSGRKLRLTAHLRCEMADLATIWMRVDGETHRSMRFDNMMHRGADGAIRGTSGWAERAIVLDIPDEAKSIHYGFFLKGYGKVWARGFSLSVVSQDVPVTNVNTEDPGVRTLPKQPLNLDFMTV
jgi:hypothetical protein